MSRVYFHSPSGQAELRGSERAWLGSLVNQIATGVLDLDGFETAERLKKYVHPSHYMASKDTTSPGWVSSWASGYATAFRVGWGDPLICYQGRTLSTFSFALNTAVLLGNDQIKLAARIHGQSEIHAWVDGPNRGWLAEIMQAGLDSGIYRKGYHYDDHAGAKQWQSMGWEDVIALLRARDDEPVVMSYSVCDSFPNADIGDYLPAWPEGIPRTHEGYDSFTEAQKEERQDAYEAWYDMEEAEKWRISMAGLRASSKGLEIKPEDWATFRFTHELSVLDLLAPDADERLAAAVERLGDNDEESA